jgi:hypothetical protein
MSDIQTIYDSLKIVRKGSEDDFELRSSEDEKTWGVRLFGDHPNKFTYVVYSGPEAKEYACDLADYEMDDADDEDDEDDED